MNKAYYKYLSSKYFDATLTERQENRLMRFLARTEDPDFDGVKAVAGFFAAGRSFNKKAGPVRRPVLHPWTYASTALAAVAMVACVVLLVGNFRKDYHTGDLASMESTLTSIFSAGTDVEAELTDLMTIDR